MVYLIGKEAAWSIATDQRFFQVLQPSCLFTSELKNGIHG